MSKAFDKQSLQKLMLEIETTLQEASAYLDAYLNCDDGNLLAQSCERIEKLQGILQLTHFDAVKDLNTELLGVLTDMQSQRKPTELQLNALCHGMLILPRYISRYAKQDKAEPQLLLSYINALRACQKKELYPEFNYADFEPPGEDRYQIEPSMTFHSIDLKQTRRMFLLGLLGYMKSEGKSSDRRAHLKMMKQSLQHLQQTYDHEIWFLALAFLESIEDGKLVLDLGRKRLLPEIDRQLRLLLKNEFKQAPKHLRDDLLYLIYLADAQTKQVKKVREVYDLTVPDKDDSYYRKSHAELYSPDRTTINAVFDEVNNHIQETKSELLDLKPGSIDDDVKAKLSNSLHRASALLGACGLTESAQSFNDSVKSLKDNKLSQEDIGNIAQAIVRVEKTISETDFLPGKTNIELRVVNYYDSDDQEEENFSPEQQVLHECESDLDVVMNLTDSFVKSKYDPAYLRDALPVLKRVQTCLEFINQEQGATLIQDLIKFISDSVERTFTQSQLNNWLNHFADTVVLIEHYLMAMRSKENPQEILGMAQASADNLSKSMMIR